MDLLDKSIILELMFNCRMSSQELADKYNSTRSVVRKRIKKLKEIGVIQKFSMWYSFEMIDGYFVFCHIRLKDSAKKKIVYSALENNPMIHVIIPTVTRDVIIHGMVIGVNGLSQLGTALRSIEGIHNVEMHLLQGERRKLTPLKNIHFRVLAPLLENSRLSGSEISRRTGLNPRRVRRIMDEINASGCVIFGLERNPILGTGIHFYMRVSWIDSKATYCDIIDELKRRFPESVWESYVSASEPIFYTRFAVEHLKDVEIIDNEVSELEEVESVEILILYPARISSIFARERLMEDIITAGYSI